MERRQQQRVRTLKAARILLNQHHSVLDCTVRNLSQVGACLNVPSTIGIPERFDVIFDADQSVRTCRMVWHKAKQLGVEFASEARPLTRTA
jgi:two-component system cell cycle response regulator